MQWMRKGWNVNPDGGDNIRQMLEKVIIKNGQSLGHRQYWAKHRTKREKKHNRES